MSFYPIEIKFVAIKSKIKTHNEFTKAFTKPKCIHCIKMLKFRQRCIFSQNVSSTLVRRSIYLLLAYVTSPIEFRSYLFCKIICQIVFTKMNSIHPCINMFWPIKMLTFLQRPYLLRCQHDRGCVKVFRCSFIMESSPCLLYTSDAADE